MAHWQTRLLTSLFSKPDVYATRMNPEFISWKGEWKDGPLAQGVDRYAKAVADKSPEWAERVTGVAASQIRKIADDLMMSDAPPGGCLDRALSPIQRHPGGARGVLSCRPRQQHRSQRRASSGAKASARAVPAVDRFREPRIARLAVRRSWLPRVACTGLCVPIQTASYRTPCWTRRLRSENSVTGAATDPDEVYDYPVKGLIVHTRNFANGNSGSPLWRKALSALLADPEGLIVDVNLFITEQGAFSHLVLPEAAYTERDDIMVPSSLYPAVHIRRAAVPAMGESKTMFEIARMLADGLAKAGFKGGGFTARDVIPYNSYLDVMKAVAGSDEVWKTLLETGVWEASDPTPRYGSREFSWSKLGKLSRVFDFYSPTLAGEPQPADKRHPGAPTSYDGPPARQGI